MEESSNSELRKWNVGKGNSAQKVGAGGASSLFIKGQAAQVRTGLIRQATIGQAGPTVKLTLRTQLKRWLFIGSASTSNNRRWVTRSTWHYTRWIILSSKAAVRKSAMPAAPFSPDSAILHFDYSLHVNSRLTVTVYLLY